MRLQDNETQAVNDNTQSNVSVQTQNTSQYTTQTPQGSLGSPEATNKKTSSAGAITGMFLVNCIPVFGFIASFIWALAVLKRSKAKLVAISTILLILNAGLTLFGYTVSINMMKNTLEKAAKSAMSTGYQTGESQKTSNAQVPNTSTDISIPGIGSDIPIGDSFSLQDIPGMNSGMLEQFIPGLSGMQGNMDDNNPNNMIPDDVTMPITDEDGNMHIDTDGDGVVDMVIDSEGNIESENAKTPSADSDGNIFIDQDGDGKNDMTIDESGNITQNGDTTLPGYDEDGNMYLDTDNDGEYDSYMDTNGILIPMGDRTKVDENGNRYIDYDGDGFFEAMIDSEGALHYDLDKDGKYETRLDNSWGEG
ncbi:MAG: hypothetical protein PHC69_06035 [Ruminiclostridium sp.]|nr:hypothetical protein [Ruminiclostridium sp.]